MKAIIGCAAACLAASLSACSQASTQIEQPSSSSRPSSVGQEPTSTGLLAMAEYVTALLSEDRIDEARAWHFRMLLRAAVYDELYENYYGFNAVNRMVGAAPNIELIWSADEETVLADLDAAISWETEAPIEPDNDAILADMPDLSAARSYVADYVREGVEAWFTERAEIARLTGEMTGGGAVSEATEIIPANAKDIVVPVASVRVGCEHSMDFMGQASRDGRVAAVRACEDLLVLDLRDGTVLQRHNERGSNLHTAVVVAGDSDIRVIILEDDLGFFELSATSGYHEIDLRLPQTVAGGAKFGIPQVARASDGGIAAYEMRQCQRDACQSWFAAYDFATDALLWEGPDLEGDRHRLISHIRTGASGPELVSEVREGERFAVPGDTEFMDLASGALRLAPRDDLMASLAERFPDCGLHELDGGQSDTSGYGYALRLAPTAPVVALSDPERTFVDSCTTSAGGEFLFVSAPPFIHAYSIVGVNNNTSSGAPSH